MQNCPRFLIKESVVNDNRFRLTDYFQIKKIRQVLRLKHGDKIILFDGKGIEYSCVLEIVAHEMVTGSIVDKKYVEAKSAIKLTVAQALPKAGKLDDIVRMCTEIGVDKFIFFESDYSIPKLKDYKPAKLERLNKIIEEATRQSERATIAHIKPMVNFNELIAETGFDLKILLCTQANESVQNIKSIKNKIEGNTIDVMLIIGPEGGFSKNEIDRAKKGGITLCDMNLPILRTETAGVVAAGFLLI